MEKWIGFILCIIGFVSIYWIRKRQFKRTSAFGTQLFKTFESFWLTRLWERLVVSIGLMFVLSGIIVVVLYWFDQV